MHIHIADRSDDNVRMILPPTSGGEAPIVRTYTVLGLGIPAGCGMAFDGTHIHMSRLSRRQCSDDPTANFGRSSPYRFYLYG